ncbi:MAG: elongation factor Ts [Patescibacteria group bacterium]|jgi:elongation factor Ts
MADAKQVVELRAKTNAGMMACKKALDEANGDMEKAIEILKRSGALKAAQKTAERTTKEGIIAMYLHHNKRMAAMLELQCESDFVAMNKDFIDFANDLVQQVAAMSPEYVSPASVPEEDMEKMRQAFVSSMADENKPEEIKAKIIQGKLDKWLQEVCLIKQPFFKDEEKTIEQLLMDKIAIIGEKIVIARFVRWDMVNAAGSDKC